MRDLQEMYSLRGTGSLQSFAGEIIEAEVASFRALRIPPPQCPLETTDEDWDAPLPLPITQRRKLGEREIAAFMAAHREGWGASLLAERFGVSQPTAYRILHRFGFRRQVHRKRKANADESRSNCSA